MTNTPTAVETAAARAMLRAARVLIEAQVTTQPENAAAIRQALRENVEIEVQLRLGPLPSARVVTVDAAGEEVATICALDLDPALLAEG